MRNASLNVTLNQFDKERVSDAYTIEIISGPDLLWVGLAWSESRTEWPLLASKQKSPEYSFGKHITCCLLLSARCVKAMLMSAIIHL